MNEKARSKAIQFVEKAKAKAEADPLRGKGSVRRASRYWVLKNSSIRAAFGWSSVLDDLQYPKTPT